MTPTHLHALMTTLALALPALMGCNDPVTERCDEVSPERTTWRECQSDYCATTPTCVTLSEDTTPPELTFTASRDLLLEAPDADEQDTRLRAEVIVAGAVVDTSGAFEVQYTLENDIGDVIEDRLPTDDFDEFSSERSGIEPPRIFSEGTYELVLVAYDRAGNTTREVVTITVRR